MAWMHPTFIRNGPAVLAARAATAGRIVERLLSAYADGANLATITANTIAGPLAMTAADFPIASGDAGSEVLTIAGKTHTLTAGVTSPAAPVPYRAIVDTATGEVLFVGPASSVGGASPPWEVGGQVVVGAIGVTFQQPA